MQLKKQSEEIKEIEGESELTDFSKPTFAFKPNEQHDWRQQGPYVVCKSCELQHAVFIGMGKVLVGIDDKGMPIFKSR